MSSYLYADKGEYNISVEMSNNISKFIMSSYLYADKGEYNISVEMSNNISK